MSEGFLRTGDATTTATLLMPARANRRAIVLYPNDASSYTISDSPSVVAGQGVTVPSGGNHVVLDRALLGELVGQAWYVIGSSAVSFGYIEVLD